ncbi:hypothetical protein NMG60_11002474 [Bertholletia excelsa]
MLPFFIFITLSLLACSVLVFSLRRGLRKAEKQASDSVTEQCSHSKLVGKPKQADESNSNLSHSLLLEVLPSNSPRWATLFDENSGPRESGLDEGRVDLGGEDCVKKKKKKRAKKKKLNSGDAKAEECSKEGLPAKEKQELVCLYPFTSTSSATQRKIKQQYDQLVKSNEASGLTLAQVGEFVNCLIEARNELQHKSEVIQRKFTITKALLCKADRSSFDRLRQQIYKLELEQKRLEEDAFVYNWLQQQLKLSPAYKKMLEISAHMELKAKSDELTENADDDISDISFEELLAQEKKDSFWQKNGKPRSCPGCTG